MPWCVNMSLCVRLHTHHHPITACRYGLGEDGVEIHVDALPINLRLKIPQGGRVSRRAKTFVRGECKVV